MSSPQCELDGDVHDDVYRNTVAAGRRKTPLPHGDDGLLIQPGAETANDANACRVPIAANHDLEVDFTLDAATPAFFRVVRSDLSDQPRGLDAAPRPEGTAAGAAAGSLAESGSRPRARPGSDSGPRASSGAHAGTRGR